MEHEFTKIIKVFLDAKFGDVGDQILRESQLISYLNIKTKSSNKGSKSRGSFANLYAIYVLVEDYFVKNFIRQECIQIMKVQFIQIFLKDSVNYHSGKSFKIMA